MAAVIKPVMKTLPLPALSAGLAAVVAFPFSAAAGSTLLVASALGAMIHADYHLRRRRVRLPRLTLAATPRLAPPALRAEPHQLAA